MPVHASEMPPLPWISVSLTETGVVLRDHQPAFSDLAGVTEDQQPSLVSFIGDRVKSTNLAALLTHPRAYRRHETIQLLRGASKTVDSPEVYADCEIHLASPGEKPRSLPLGRIGNDNVTYKLDWSCNRKDTSKAEDFPSHVIANVLTPLSSVLCIFADDLGGFPGVARFLAQQVALPLAHSLPPGGLPHVLVVVNASSTTYDDASAAEVLIAQTLEIIQKNATATYVDTVSALRDLKSRYRAVSVHGFAARVSPRQRTASLKERLVALQKEVYWSRRTGGYLFNAKHVTEFSRRMIAHLAKNAGLFNFLQQSRTRHFETGQLLTHLEGLLLNLMPSQEWLWSVIIPLVTSAFFLASYPPEAHHFPPEQLFNEFFISPCKQALSLYTRDVDVQARALSDIKAKLGEQFRRLEFDPIGHNALDQHRDCLQTLWPHLADLKSNRSCLSCLMFQPEKVFQCGHAICDVCIRRFGRSSSAERYSFRIPSCVLCGCVQSNECDTFRLKPPTAGLRILSVDGGGVRGVIPLMFLNHFEDELSVLGGYISDCFDYVCGTSAGGLVAMGVFLMRWSPSECLRRFEELASDTFKGREQDATLTWSRKLERVFRVCLQGYRYSWTPIERAFQSKTGPATKMFNALQSDTKVAVTTTFVKNNSTGVISNYNYGPRLTEATHRHIRATNPQYDMSISEAASCTSAAPFYFKAKDVPGLATFHDGALNHNCPARVAIWESKVIWQEDCDIHGGISSNVRLDHFLSLGTGATTSSILEMGHHSPQHTHFLRRGYSHAGHVLDAQRQWREFMEDVPTDLQHKFTRLNAPLLYAEPAIDDVAAMTELKGAASTFIASDTAVAKVTDKILASLFYLEVNHITKTEHGMSRASVTIYCRLPLEFSERRKFYHFLLRKHAFFVANGKVIPCVMTLPCGFPMYRCTFDLLVGTMQEDIDIHLTGITSEHVSISGMPTQLDRLVKAQDLNMPFGCVDNRCSEKQLPSTPLKLLPSSPQKRTAAEIS